MRLTQLPMKLKLKTMMIPCLIPKMILIPSEPFSLIFGVRLILRLNFFLQYRKVSITLETFETSKVSSHTETWVRLHFETVPVFKIPNRHRRQSSPLRASCDNLGF